MLFRSYELTEAGLTIPAAAKTEIKRDEGPRRERNKDTYWD